MEQGIEKSLGDQEIRDDMRNVRAELEVVKIELFSELLLLALADKKSRVKYPDYWAPFRDEANQIEIEIIDATDRTVKKERDRIIELFAKSGAEDRPNVVSLKRIQNRDRLQKVLAETRKHHALGSNDDPFERTHHLFHGPKGNLDNILQEGGLSTKYSKSHSGGQSGRIWLHQTSSYSMGYANLANNGNKRMFICRAISNIGGRGGGVYIFKNDHHVLIEYLIEWKTHNT